MASSNQRNWCRNHGVKLKSLKACLSLQESLLLWRSTRKQYCKCHTQLPLILGTEWLYVLALQKRIWGLWWTPSKTWANNVPLRQRFVFCKVNLALQACMLELYITSYFPDSTYRVFECSIQQRPKDLFTHSVKINIFSICLE